MDNSTSRQWRCPAIMHQIATHPSLPILGAAALNGALYIVPWTGGQHSSIEAHTGACRAIQIAQIHAYTGGKDGSIAVCDLDRGLVVARKQGKAAISAMTMIGRDSADPIVMSGDDDGKLALWDVRTSCSTAVNAVAWDRAEHTEYISCIFATVQGEVVAGSGDGHMTIWDLRSGRPHLVAKSDHIEDEVSCMAQIKNGRKLVCGSVEGYLLVFANGTWGDYQDRVPGHPCAINSMVALDDDTLCTGADDGIIRVVHLYPHGLVGILGQHSDELPVEGLALSYDRTCVASISQDELIRFWSCAEDDDDITEHGSAAIGQSDTHNSFFADL